LQEPVPSVLDERPDLPPAVGRVIARAMAKLPGNRYQTVAELVEDLMIASGIATFAPVPVQTPSATASVVSDSPDEVTVVRTREAPPMTPRRAPVTVPIQAPAAAPPETVRSFNPLKVIIPSVVALLVVFAAIYALKRNSAAQDQNSNQPQSTLAADPNSQPVQPGASPTGKGEEGIPAGGKITPPPNVNENNSNANSNVNRKASPLPEPTRTVVPEGVPSPVATKPPEKASPVPTPTPPK
jgi:hypothetical protein